MEKSKKIEVEIIIRTNGKKTSQKRLPAIVPSASSIRSLQSKLRSYIKSELIKMVQDDSLSCSQIAETIGISKRTLFRWLKLPKH